MNISIFTLALVVPSLALAAGEKIDQTVPTGSTPKVVIENMRGKVTVKGWQRNEVRVTGHLDKQTDQFVFDHDDSNIKIVVDAQPTSGNWNNGSGEGSDLIIHLPVGASLEAEGFATDFSIDGIIGEIDLDTVSGELRVTGNRSRIDLETVSGDLRISDQEGVVFAESVSGDIDFTGIATRLELDSVQGDINVNNQGNLDEGEFNSVSGDIETKTHTADKTHLEYNAVNGDVDISFLNNINAKIEIDTMNGDIHNHLTDDAAHKQRWAGSSLVYTVGDGSGDIRISTVSGNITIE